MKIKMLSKKLLIAILSISMLAVPLSTPAYAEEASSSTHELPSELQTLKESYPSIQSEEEQQSVLDKLYPDFEVVKFSHSASCCTISKNPNTSQFEAKIGTETVPLQTNKVIFVDDVNSGSFCDSYIIDSSVQDFTFAILPALPGLSIYDKCPISLESGADVTFEVNTYLKIYTGIDCTDYNESDGNLPAISVPEGANLTITGSGFLDCEIYEDYDHYPADNEDTGLAAAIGTAGYGSSTGQHSTPDCGDITIKDGITVYASSPRGPGIGSGAIYGSTCNQYSGDCGIISIENATVISTCGGYSPAIGSGGVNARSCSAYAGDTSTINITNSTVAADGGNYAPAIGAGGACSGSLDAHGGNNGSICVINSDIYSPSNKDDIFGGGHAKAPLFKYNGKDGNININANSTIHPNCCF